MKYSVLCFLLACSSSALYSQAPDWHWARAIAGGGYSSVTVLATAEGGCYVAADTQVIRYNDFGDILWTTDFSDNVSLFKTEDESSAGFIMQYEENAEVSGEILTAPPGISFVTGFFNGDGSLYDVQNLPALLVTTTTVTVTDAHRGPAGDLLLIGFFSDSLGIADTTIQGYSNSVFLAKFAMLGDLYWSRSLMNSYGTTASVEQVPSGDIYISVEFPEAEEGDTLFSSAGGSIGRFSGEGELIWSHATDGGSLAGDKITFDVDPPGNVYYMRQTAGMNNEITFLGAVDGSGELMWETPEIDFFYPANVSHGPSGVLFSGWRFSAVDLQGCAYVPSSSPRTFMLQFGNDEECDWIKESPDPVNAFNGYAVEGPQGIYYTVGSIDYTGPVGFATDTVHFPPGGPPKPYVGRLGVLPMSADHRSIEQYDLLTLHPVPARGELFVSVPGLLRGEQAFLYDPIGRSIGSFTFNDQTERIDIGGLSAGTYVLKCGGQFVRLVIE